MPIEIVIPRETANDDVVRLVRWFAQSGDLVRKGEVVAEIETSKSVIEIVAPENGRLTIMTEAGSDAAVSAAIGSIEMAAAGGFSAPPSTASSGLPDTLPRGPRNSGASISLKAREKLAAHGLDESAVAHLEIVRERDVDALIAKCPAPPCPESRSTTERIRPPSAAYRPRGLLGDAQRSAADRHSNVLWLAWNYFWRNWLLGNLVRVAPVGIRNMLHRLRGVRMGLDCFIDPTAILETAYPENITLGDDVRVTAGAIVMTHIKAPHLLRDKGYVPTVIKPVTLCSHSFIGVNAVVMPGVTIGEGAVVTSGSVVLSDVPPFTMVLGNPAKVVKRFL